MIAVTQIRNARTEGRASYEPKVSEGKTKKEALRSLKRQISNAVYRQLVLDAGSEVREDTKGTTHSLRDRLCTLHDPFFCEVVPGPTKAFADASFGLSARSVASKAPKLRS